MCPGGRVWSPHVLTIWHIRSHRHLVTPYLDFDGLNVQGIYPGVWEEWEVKYFISGRGNMGGN